MGVILQVALPSRELAAARLQCGAAGAGASRGLGVCAEHARLAARGESARAMEIGDFLGRLGLGRFSQCGYRRLRCLCVCLCESWKFRFPVESVQRTGTVLRQIYTPRVGRYTHN